MTVTAATPDSPKLVTLPGVPIAQIGEWDCSTGPTKFTKSMMDSAIRASMDPGIGPPRIKRGHSSTDADPLLGLAVNLAWADDDFVTADLAGLDPDEAAALPFRYPDRSLEGRRNVTSPVTGEKYEFVIPYIAMLPIDGAVETLPNLPLPAHLEAGELVAASKHFDVLASWDPDVVRREWDAQMNGSDGPADGPGNGGRRYTYVEQIELDPNSVIVSDGSDNFRIPFSISATSDVTFDTEAKTAVVRAYVPKSPSTPEESVAAAAAPRVAKRYEPGRSTGQNPNDNKETSMDLTKLRALFNLGDDATDEQVRAAAKENGLSIIDAAGGGDGDPDPKPDEKPDEKPAGFQVPEGMALVDQETLDGLKSGIEVAASLRKEKDEDVRDAALNDAVLAGKFPPARVEHYKTLWGADPEGTKSLIDTLAPGVVPVTAESGIMAGKSAVGAEAQVDAIAASFGVTNVAGKGA